MASSTTDTRRSLLSCLLFKIIDTEWGEADGCIFAFTYFIIGSVLLQAEDGVLVVLND